MCNAGSIELHIALQADILYHYAKQNEVDMNFPGVVQLQSIDGESLVVIDGNYENKNMPAIIVKMFDDDGFEQEIHFPMGPEALAPIVTILVQAEHNMLNALFKHAMEEKLKNDNRQVMFTERFDNVIPFSRGH